VGRYIPSLDILGLGKNLRKQILERVMLKLLFYFSLLFIISGCAIIVTTVDVVIVKDNQISLETCL